MGDFFDSIKPDLDAIDNAPGPRATFGVDYSGNSTVVTQVQTAINALGYLPQLAIDGSNGPATIAGVKWLQAQHGLVEDGIIGDQTLGALGITPPTGVSVDYAKGALKGAAAVAVAALQAEFPDLFAWAQSNPQPVVQGKGIAPGFTATKNSVVNSYVGWTTPLEGFLPWMYIDALGYVTTGMGNLIDPIGAALSLPWKNSDGSMSTPEQITAAWNAVDAQRTAPKGQKQGGAGAAGGGTQGGVTSIRITKADVQNLVAQKLRQNEAILVSGLPNFAKAPADAQLAAHSMAWAMGPGFAQTWAQFRAAFNSGDFTTAAAQSTMKGTGIEHRNDANKLLLKNAHQVVLAKKNPDTLYYITGLADLYGGMSLKMKIGIAVGAVALVGGGIAATLAGRRG